MFCEVLQESMTFTILSFNCWGIPIPFVVKDYKERMKSINKAIFVEGIYDVVCLQEIWSLNDFKTFQRDSENKYPFSHYFHSGVFGSGVCIFSKWPIVEVLFHKWQVNGYIHKIFHGDWYGGKGVGLCRLDVNGYKVNIYTCHTHAEYSKSAEYIAHQVVQVYDTAQFIRISSENADLTILAADLNTEPGELCYRIINSYADLNDSFEVNKLELSGTYDNSRNSYRNITEGDPNGQRIDYILYKIGNNSLIKCLSYNTPLDSRIPGQNFSYSDHEAISATFQFLKQKSFGDCDGNIKCLSREKEIMDSVKEGYHICEKAARKLRYDIKVIKLKGATVFIILLLTFLIFIFLGLASGLTFLIFILALFFVSFIFFIVYLWKKIEYNGILCSLNGMKISLENNK